jgi:DNA polymerase-3 subunit delta
MTTIRTDAGDRFVRSPPPETRFFLVHGVDEGLVHERAKTLVAAVLAGNPDPFGLTRLDGDVLAREPGRIADEAYAVSMFGGRRAIWVEAGSRDLTKQIQPLLARPPEDAVLIVEAGNLKRDAPLRALFERADNAASIECPRDERRSIAALIEQESAAAGLRFAPEARDHLLALLGSDRQTTRTEVAKLLLFALGGARVEVADVEAIVTDAAPSSLDGLIDQSLLGELAEVEQLVSRFFSDGGDLGHLSARLASRILLLHSAALETRRSDPIDGTARNAAPRPWDWKRAAMAKQAERWDAAAVSQRLPAILAAVARARREARLGPAIATRALWALASGARARRG